MVAGGSQSHQLGRRGEVVGSVGISDVAHVCGEGGKHSLYIHAILVPGLQAADGESVAQPMKAGPLASRSADPNQLRQLSERVINRVSRETLVSFRPACVKSL